MKASPANSDMLKTFRYYAVSRLIFTLMMVPFRATPARTIGLRSHFFTSRQNWLLAFVVIENCILLVYLLVPTLQRWLGRVYEPIAIVYATAGLLLEQDATVGGGIFQSVAFLYILAILVAWQYRYGILVIYALAIIIVQVITGTASSSVSNLPGARVTAPGMIAQYPIPRDYLLYFSRLFTLLIIGYAVNRLTTGLKERHRQLAEANERLQAQSKVVEQLAVSNERNRISRDLHDTVAHALTSLIMQTDVLAMTLDPISPATEKILDQMQATARSGLEETRSVVKSLRAAELQTHGLAASIRQLVSGFASKHGMPVDAGIDIGSNIINIPAPVQQCYYRVAQEALENIARHADATAFRVALTLDDCNLQMVISDNGKGFVYQDEATEDHFGIRGMMERAEMIDGKLEVISTPGEGTHITLTKELPRDHRIDL